MSGGDWAILLSGNVQATARLRAQLAGCRVLAADAGLRHAEPLGLSPEEWIGDFDSAPAELMTRRADVPRQVHPAEKDSTDGELAIARALSEGARRVVLVGAFGGRADHVLMHMMQLLALAERGVSALASSGREEAWPLLPGNPLRIDLPEGALFSVIGLSSLKGLGIGGARWPLEGAETELGESRTLSNVVAGSGGVEVSLAEGRGILLAQLTEGG